MRVRDPRLLVVVSAALLGAAVAFPLGALASHQFTDVPTSSTYHADIDAIRDAGITTGCATGKYCPKDFVTREQMAAFLNRLGALQAGKTPVVNATKVDGYDAGSLTRVAGDYVIATTNVLVAGSVYGTVTINAPTSGYVLVTSATTIRNAGCTVFCHVSGAINHVGTASYSTYSTTTVAPGALYGNITATAVFDVAAGNNTFAVVLYKDPAANANLQGYWGMLTAHFSPFAGGSFARDEGAAATPTKK
jgi:hypothetical protein